MFQSLFSSFIQDNEAQFLDDYHELDSYLSTVKIDTNKVRLKTEYENRYLSLVQRIQNIEKTYLDFKDLVDQIKKDHRQLNYQGKSLNKLGLRVNAISKKSGLKRHGIEEKDTKDDASDVSTLPQSTSIVPEAPVKTDEKTTKKGKRKIRCGNKKHDFLSMIPIGKPAMCWRCRKENKKGYNFIVTQELIIDER